jgi:N-acetylglutamate synthase-like GNAT family acetyltransferase
MSEDKTKMVRIGTFAESQIEAVVALELECSAMYRKAGFSEAQAPARTLREIAQLYKLHNVRVAEVDGVVAGYLAWRDESPGVAYIEELSVHPNFQRTGVGKALLAKARAEAKEAHLQHVVIRTFPKAAWAAAFWKKAGFSPLGEGSPEVVKVWQKEQGEKGTPTREGQVAMTGLV